MGNQKDHKAISNYSALIIIITNYSNMQLMAKIIITNYTNMQLKAKTPTTLTRIPIYTTENH